MSWGTIFPVTFWLHVVFKFQNRIVSLQQESSGLDSAREAPAVHSNKAVLATDQTVPKGGYLPLTLLFVSRDIRCSLYDPKRTPIKERLLYTSEKVLATDHAI